MPSRNHRRRNRHRRVPTPTKQAIIAKKSLWDSLGPDVENYILELAGGLEHREKMEEMLDKFNNIVRIVASCEAEPPWERRRLVWG